jgi:hypothetical protein
MIILEGFVCCLIRGQSRRWKPVNRRWWCGREAACQRDANSETGLLRHASIIRQWYDT